MHPAHLALEVLRYACCRSRCLNFLPILNNLKIRKFSELRVIGSKSSFKIGYELKQTTCSPRRCGGAAVGSSSAPVPHTACMPTCNADQQTQKRRSRQSPFAANLGEWFRQRWLAAWANKIENRTEKIENRSRIESKPRTSVPGS